MENTLPTDGHGQTLHPGDRVCTQDWLNGMSRIDGTIIDNREAVGEMPWLVKWDDGNTTAVVEFSTIFKA